MRLFSFLCLVLGVLSTNSSSLSPTRSRIGMSLNSTHSRTQTHTANTTRSLIRTGTGTGTPNRTRTLSASAVPTRSANLTATRSKSGTITGSATRSAIGGTPTSSSSSTFTNTGTQTGTQSNTITQSNTGTQSGSSTITHTALSQNVGAPASSSSQDAPNIQYIAIGSVMGCLVLMTIVAIAILFSTRKSSTKKPLHYLPTMMNVPSTDLGSMNPLSSRTLFPPLQSRGLTTITD